MGVASGIGRMGRVGHLSAPSPASRGAANARFARPLPRRGEGNVRIASPVGISAALLSAGIREPNSLLNRELSGKEQASVFPLINSGITADYQRNFRRSSNAARRTRVSSALLLAALARGMRPAFALRASAWQGGRSCRHRSVDSQCQRTSCRCRKRPTFLQRSHSKKKRCHPRPSTRPSAGEGKGTQGARRGAIFGCATTFGGAPSRASWVPFPRARAEARALAGDDTD